MVSEDLNEQLVLSLLVLVNDGVVKGVLVLLKPSRDVVTDLFWGNEVESDQVEKIFLYITNYHRKGT